MLSGRRQAPLDAVAAQIEDGRALVVPTDVTDPDSIANLFAQTKSRFGRLDLLFNNAGIGAPPVPWKTCRSRRGGRWWTPTSPPCSCAPSTPSGSCATRIPGRADHQQRLDLGACPAAELDRLYGHETRGDGLTKATSLDGRAYDIACGQIDIGNADTPMGGKMKEGVAQADGSIRAEAVMDPDHVGDAVLMMANLPCPPTSSSSPSWRPRCRSSAAAELPGAARSGDRRARRAGCAARDRVAPSRRGRAYQQPRFFRARRAAPIDARFYNSYKILNKTAGVRTRSRTGRGPRACASPSRVPSPSVCRARERGAARPTTFGRPG